MTEEMTTAVVYATYSAVAVGLTIWLAQTLFKHGGVFLRDVFEDNEPLADGLNRLLVTGFYMLNLGYALFLFRGTEATDAITATEALVSKLGVLLLSLGVIHFVNLLVFWKVRRSALRAAAPPAPPQVVLAGPAPQH